MIKTVIESTELRPDMLVKQIRARKAEIEKVLLEKEKALRDAPEGKLRIDRKGNSPQYYHRINPTNKGSVYLNREQDSLASLLAQKDYDCKLIRELNVAIIALDRLLEDYRPGRIDELYLSFHDNRKSLIRPVILLDEEYIKRWMNIKYDRKRFEENTPEFYTANGERVRSKSELIIADALSRFKIPYRYEYPIRISGSGTFHPDFTCLNLSTRKEYIWEHNGMMSDSDYADYAINRMEKYFMSGYFPGENLLLTFESSSRPLNSRVIELYIRKYLL